MANGVELSEVSEKYNLDEQELKDLWGNEDFKKVKILKKTETDSNKSSDSSEYSKMNKNELIEICKTKGIKVSGTKNELIERLLNGGVVSSKNEKNTKITPCEPEIIKKLVSKLPTISISRNKFGNYEHSETLFVFNNKNKKVIGKQNADGTISNLTKDDIDICNKYKFGFEIPENLDSNKNGADVEIDELDEKEDEEEKEEEFEEHEFEEEDDEEEMDDEEEVEEEMEEEEYYDDD